MARNFFEQPSVISISNTRLDKLKSSFSTAQESDLDQMMDYLQIYRNQEDTLAQIELVLRTPQALSEDQILAYLDELDKHRHKLSKAFIDENKITDWSIPVLYTEQSCYSKLNDDSKLHELMLIQPKTVDHFLQSYNPSLKQSIRLLQKLYPILKSRAVELDIMVSRNIDALEHQVKKTDTLMTHLLQTAEYMDNWTSQLMHNPDLCDLEEFNFMEGVQIPSRTIDTRANQDATLDVMPLVDEEQTDTNLFAQYKTLKQNLNLMIDACIEEQQDFEGLKKIMEPNGRFNKLQQCADEQELILNAQYKSTRFRIEKWRNWRQKIVRYLKSYTSRKASSLNEHQCFSDSDHVHLINDCSSETSLHLAEREIRTKP